MSEILLTIDDSPSPDTDELTAFLQAQGVNAILFCRGDRLRDNPDPVVRAVERGFVAANHAFHHRRASQISFDEVKTEILETEALLDQVYQRAGCARPALYFRFPHMDRGAGGWIVDYNAAPAHEQTLRRLFVDGLNTKLAPPTAEQVDKKSRLQEFLRVSGFTALPAQGVTHEWYRQTEVAQAVDAMFTFSTSDWMLTQRHLGKWPCKSIGDLKQKIDNDPWLAVSGSDNIVLAHDQPEILPVVKALVGHMLHKGFSFKPV
ncbi:MAG: polysaccharide deacetylase family protein [Micavibrio aeruginosavorus]|uniref:Polysaccharide deacetylase family protein n=1 Tax=Micavibrio aeruginosavorus TaxID=349221 RepID=A0A7T5R351_9BACT|nr:MAG: polysaccharide deacetylase family protein [Micavibrio aeruginosavorus]